MMFIPDAIDTMAHQINWMILILAQRPQLQEQLQQELQDIIGNRIIKLNDQSKFTKFSAFLLETLRFVYNTLDYSESPTIPSFHMVHLFYALVVCRSYDIAWSMVHVFFISRSNGHVNVFMRERTQGGSIII